jgi:hypothetical protein
MHVRVILAVLFAAVPTSQVLSAGDTCGLACGAGCPPCPQEQTVYQDVTCHRCKLVPETKQTKKTVYQVQEVPFCLKKLPPLFSLLHHHGCCNECERCAECACPRYKKVLVKKEVVCKEICGSKCVPVEFVEKVPCRVCTAPSAACANSASPTCAARVQTGPFNPPDASAPNGLIAAPPLPSAE